MQIYQFRKSIGDEKGGNWLTLSYSDREKPRSWERLQRDFFEHLPTEALSTSTLSGHPVVNFLPDHGFFAFLLRLFTDTVA